MVNIYKNIDDYIGRFDRFIISTHESPDWDGLGAEIALLELLKSLGKKPIILNSDPAPLIFSFLDLEGDIRVLDDAADLPHDIGDYAQFVLDTNDYDNIGTACRLLKDRVRDCFIIDHHEGGEDKFESNMIRADASSTCEILYGIIRHYGKPITLRAAQALMAGIVFDTGSFVYAKTTAETFHIASELVKLGVVPFFIHEQIYEQNSLSSFELRSHILSTMEVYHDGKMIAMKLTPEMLDTTGATFTEGEPAINLPFAVKGVVTSLLVKQDYTGPVKVSMRSKGNLDVAKIAIENDGGGHRNAAGYKSKQSFEETYKTAVEKMGVLFKNS
jgi:phosphoesterase RecJ-like protein